MRKTRLLILICLTFFISIVSCTYDYFEDETNYLVFVQEVLDNSISDCRIMIYDEAGTLVGERYGKKPWDTNPRMTQGIFSFQLPPGRFKVYCYTNTDSISFNETRSYEQSAYTLQQNGIDNSYTRPSDLHFQILKPEIIHSGIVYTDTVDLKRYVGRITVRFKKFPVETTDITTVKMVAKNIATMQYLKSDTLTTRVAEEDLILAENTAVKSDGTTIEIDNRFFPTIEDVLTNFNFDFLDNSGQSVIEIPASLKEAGNGAPLRLLHGRRLIVEIEGYTVVKISVLGWNEDIEDSGVIME